MSCSSMMPSEQTHHFVPPSMYPKAKSEEEIEEWIQKQRNQRLNQFLALDRAAPSIRSAGATAPPPPDRESEREKTQTGST